MLDQPDEWRRAGDENMAGGGGGGLDVICTTTVLFGETQK